MSKLKSAVLYRGYLYQEESTVTLVGTPTREVVYTPPKGDACFAVRADRVRRAHFRRRSPSLQERIRRCVSP